MVIKLKSKYKWAVFTKGYSTPDSRHTKKKYALRNVITPMQSVRRLRR